MNEKWGVWITEIDGSDGRWLMENIDADPVVPWSGSYEDAEMFASQRRPVHRSLRYTVKPFDGELAA